MGVEERLQKEKLKKERLKEERNEERVKKEGSVFLAKMTNDSFEKFQTGI